MAQGTLKSRLKKAPKSGGSQKRKAIRAKTVQSKGRKQKKASRAAAVQANKPIEEATKQINKRNEALIAAKAVSSGAKFYLNDISERGLKEQKDQIRQRNKKQDKANSMTGRLKEQIKQLESGKKR
jgi:hypothetical protein